jgi:peptidoglycan/LPS O-acetylase OafA/YrhL
LSYRSNTDVLHEPLNHKPHFHVLDGLRGLAALAVVIFHFMEWVYTDPSRNFIGHGFLAVDFFFCLSGFVIGYAYDERMGTMSLWTFFKARMIRLHPLVISGSVLGLIAFLFDPFGGDPGVYSAGNIALLFLCSALMIPLPIMADRGFNLFGLNAPSWSLFWEYVANIVYALVLCKLDRRIILFLTVIAAGALCFVAYTSGNLLGGWSGPTFWDGSARISYSFLMGLLIWRYQWIIKNKSAFVGITVLLCLAFIMPFTKFNWLTELSVVLVYFPLLVALGAGSKLSPRSVNFCKLSGQLSYPLYMTHYAALWMFGNYYTSRKPNSTELTFIVISGVVFVVLVSYLVMVYYDQPVRKKLSKALLSNNS